MGGRIMSLLLTACGCLAFVSVEAQTTVEGTVRDNQTKETLIGAAVVIDGTTIGSTTDFDGRFSFVTNETPPFRLSISFLGYKTKTVSVSLGNTKNLSISLESDAVLMEAVEVKAQRISQKQQQAAPEHQHARQAQQRPLPFEILQRKGHGTPLSQ